MRWPQRFVSLRLVRKVGDRLSTKYWDALSKGGSLRKLHPRIMAWNGTDFPNRRSKGNRIPFWSGDCGQKLDRDLARIGVRLNR